MEESAGKAMARVVHLPCYQSNPYQRLLMQCLRDRGVDAIDGGGGGNFFRSALYRWKADIIHLHWLHPYIIRKTWLGTVLRGARLIVELAVLRLSGKRLVWTVHNLQNHDNQFANVERFVSRWVSLLCQSILCHSFHAAKTVQSVYGINASKISVSPHPVWGTYLNLKSLAVAREQLGLDPSKRVFLFLGRIAPYKGVEHLVTAFRELTEESVILLIAGSEASAEYTRQIEMLIADDPRIHMHVGYVPNDEMQTYLNSADVVVFPFRDILTSGSILLAMEFGKACIAPAVGAIPETLPPQQDLLIYHQSESGGLKNALKRSIEIGDQLADIGTANRIRAEVWTWEQLADDCMKLYGLNGEAGLNQR